MNWGGRVLNDKTDFADRLRHRLADQVEAGQLFDPLPPQGDLVEAQNEAEQPARIDQAEQDDIAGSGISSVRINWRSRALTSRCSVSSMTGYRLV